MSHLSGCRPRRLKRTLRQPPWTDSSVHLDTDVNIGGPVCTFVYLATLLATSNNLATAYHAMYSISIFLPLLVVIVRWKMQDGRLFQHSNFRTRRIPWVLLLKRYWLRILGTSSAFFLYDFVNFPNSIMSSVIINSLVPG